MKILVTGFDPFGGDKINPAIEAVKRLPDEINGAEIIKLEIPTVFNKSAEVVRKAIEKENPDYVLNATRSGVNPERPPACPTFNTLPVALLEMKDQMGVIKQQAPIAVILLIVQIGLMYFLAF